MTQTRILPRFDFRVEIAAETVTGKVRATNEDALLVAPELALFGVADGMGGLDSGEHASRTALEVARAYLATKEANKKLEEFCRSPTLEVRRDVFALLRGACEAAHDKLVSEQESRGEKMGTTMDLCLFARDKAFVAHVGDGRVFLARSKATLQITEDHLVHDPASVRRPGGPGRTPRPLASGVGLPVPLRVDVFPVDLRRGDTLVLATDGAYGPMESEAAISHACRGTPRAICDAFVKSSLARGGRDNASIVAVRIDERFLQRSDERGAFDTSVLRDCPLLEGLPPSSVLGVLSGSIEIELEAGADVPPFDAGDHCAYIVLDGLVKTESGTTLGAPAVLFPESLVGVDLRTRRAAVVERLRTLRIRRDDFREICAHDPVLGMTLFEKLATHIARTR
ncbi:MAG: protein phosphatase 2C domain-containing protein [Myxococcales bacterium]|nr:protein phosphatase 2C domain-containing protein [Myxococcales bacterium]